jgi:hypothetical protein
MLFEDFVLGMLSDELENWALSEAFDDIDLELNTWDCGEVENA